MVINVDDSACKLFGASFEEFERGSGKDMSEGIALRSFHPERKPRPLNPTPYISSRIFIISYP